MRYAQMRHAKWMLAAGLLAVTAGCMQTTGYSGGYPGGYSYGSHGYSRSGSQWNTASRDYDRDGIPNRYDRDANGDGIDDRYQRR